MDDIEFAESMGRNGKKMVNCYSPSLIFSQWIRLIREVYGECPGSLIEKFSVTDEEYAVNSLRRILSMKENLFRDPAAMELLRVKQQKKALLKFKQKQLYRLENLTVYNYLKEIITWCIIQLKKKI
jgi:hypothetical protein